MTPNQRKSVESTIRHFVIHNGEGIDSETLRLIDLASADLYYGPIGPTDEDGEPWPGFEKACAHITSALGDVSELYIDLESDCIVDSEPTWLCDGRCGYGEKDGGCENHDDGEDPTRWVHYERADVIRVLVGSELAPYVR